MTKLKITNLPLKTIETIIFIILLVIIITQRSENNKLRKVTVDIVTPEIVDSFTDNKPTEIRLDSVFIKQVSDSIKYKFIEALKNQEKEYVYYKSVPEEIRDTIYIEATKPRIYSKLFEDENVKINYTALTKGTLESLDLDYTIKPKTISTEVIIEDKVKSHLYLGGFIENNIRDNSQSFSAVVGLMNKKGNLIQVSYSTDKTIRVGYLKKLF